MEYIAYCKIQAGIVFLRTWTYCKQQHPFSMSTRQNYQRAVYECLPISECIHDVPPEMGGNKSLLS